MSDRKDFYFLSTSKFQFLRGESYISTDKGQDRIVSFHSEIDTQSFLIVSNLIYVIHHQFNKQLGCAPCEVFDIKTGRLVCQFGLDDEVYFPTAIEYLGDHLVVACNGRGFKGEIFLYDVHCPEDPKFVRKFALGPEQARPTGMVFSEGSVYVASYSSQSIWQLDLETGKFDRILDVSRFGQTTPMGLYLADDRLFVLGHLDGSLVAYNRKYMIPEFIQREGLKLPWSICSLGDRLLVSNIGADRTLSHRGSLAYFYHDGDFLTSEPCDGVTVLRAMQ